MGRTGKSITTLTRNLFEEAGYITTRVEHWNAFAKVRQDFFGIGDVCAVPNPIRKPVGGKLIVIQVTTKSHLAEHLYKILRMPATRGWLLPGSSKLFVVAWDTSAGGKYKVVEIVLDISGKMATSIDVATGSWNGFGTSKDLAWMEKENDEIKQTGKNKRKALAKT